ncbi:hypothetical protein CTI12_AA215590 [Artemisia annua]|uniref:Helitron helicase-like domain-containing protein n=1 Tax=Artemisia annua TaxID=35608 RepID=A0A2U1NY17_ARTAN|nr:hypothetical protein CTI12_AA215590 [Artemisia annua]
MEYDINDLRIRCIGKPPSKNSDSKGVEHLQKCKSIQPKTSNTINIPAEQRVLPLTQDPSIARRPRGRPIKDVNEPRDNGATNGIDTRKRSFNGISKDYKDHGDPIYKYADCDALLWRAKSVVGSTHPNSGSFSLYCGRGKAMLTNEGYGTYYYRIQGENYHLMGTLLPEKDKKSAFAQLYNYDKANEIQNRINGVSGEPTTTSGASALDHQLIVDLRDMLDSINPLVAQFRMAEKEFSLWM